jgi:hemerythrin-like metal-binding protein
MDFEYGSLDRDIDMEHRNLCSILDDITEAIKTQGLIEPLLEQLLHDSVIHFKNEEAKMQFYKFPREEYERHKEAHIKLISVFEEMLERYTNSPVRNYIYYRFVDSWLKNHFKGMDSKFADFLNNKK